MWLVADAPTKHAAKSAKRLMEPSMSESQEIFQRTGDAVILHNCPTAALDVSVRMEYDAGLVDNLCQKCK
jgi:hypothetical protein